MRSINVPPFGYKALNGLDFSRSVKRPYSRLGKVVRYLLQNGPRTKTEIMRNVFNVVQADPHVQTWAHFQFIKVATGLTAVRSIRGQHSYLFSGAVKCGFITMTRVGKKVLYSYGPMGYMVRI